MARRAVHLVYCPPGASAEKTACGHIVEAVECTRYPETATCKVCLRFVALRAGSPAGFKEGVHYQYPHGIGPRLIDDAPQK